MFSEYSGRCVGRCMRFLYEYSVRFDDCQFGGDNKIFYGAEHVATYTWDGDTDVPTFTFYGSFAFCNEIQQSKKYYITAQETMIGRNNKCMWDIASADNIVYANCEIRNPEIGQTISVPWKGRSEDRKIIRIEDGVLYTVPYPLTERWKKEK